MKKSEPRAIINFSIKDEDFEEKMNIAIKNYMETYANARLDEEFNKMITKRVQKRVDSLINSDSKSYCRPKIDGKTLDELISGKIDKKIEEVIDKNIKEIFAKKVAEML